MPRFITFYTRIFSSYFDDFWYIQHQDIWKIWQNGYWLLSSNHYNTVNWILVHRICLAEKGNHIENKDIHTDTKWWINAGLQPRDKF